MTMDLTMALQLNCSPRYLLAATYLAIARRNMPANPPPIKWAEHRHDRVAPIRGSLAF